MLKHGIPPQLLLAIVLIILALSGINPVADRLTWLLETVPVMVGTVVLVFIWQRFPLTPLCGHLLAIHAAILMIGGYYTYAEVPLFDHLQEWLGASRNHYDRVGHFAQGFVPAILTREILLRRTCLQADGWLWLLTTSVCLAFSAFYELIEWWVALLSGEAADAFLGTQGDNWDTQWDMFFALCGALTAQLMLGKWHNQQTAALISQSDERPGLN